MKLQEKEQEVIKSIENGQLKQAKEQAEEIGLIKTIYGITKIDINFDIQIYYIQKLTKEV